jgi:hypothetical protein
VYIIPEFHSTCWIPYAELMNKFSAQLDLEQSQGVEDQRAV